MKARAAELAFQRIMQTAGYVVHHAKPNTVKRGPLWITNSNDLWSCIDLAGVHPTAGFWLVQVTTSSGVAQRKRNVAAVAWPLEAAVGQARTAHALPLLRVSVAEAKKRRDDVDPRHVRHYFRVHDLKPGGSWMAREAVYVEPIDAPPERAAPS